MSIEVNERPLVTFFVCAYQQERFIREAVEGAFAQTYSPLEIILSDDCSSDRTFAIMREMAAAYRGPHQIILNRNEKNLGIGGHINRIFELSHGELLVASAGDDVSLPERTEKLTTSWVCNKRPPAICSGHTLIGEDGQVLPGELASKANSETGYPNEPILRALSFAKEEVPTPFGCAAAWERKLFEIFGPLPPNVTNEDNVLGFRAAILGGALFIDDVLVKYRIHGANAWSRFADSAGPSNRRIMTENRQKRIHACRATQFAAHLIDAERAAAAGLIPIAQAPELVDFLRTREKAHAIRSQWWDLGIATRAVLAFGLALEKAWQGKPPIFPDELKWRVSRLLPFAVWRLVAAAWTRLRY